MTTGIKPKQKQKDRLHNQHAKRYVFYPLRNLDFHGSQATSPIYCPKIPRAEIVLLESFTYKTSDDGHDVFDEFKPNEQHLVEKIMGTDAQVKFLMGSNTEGLGVSGMTLLESLTDVDTDIVIGIQDFIYPDGKIPDNLVKLKTHLEGKAKETVSELELSVIREMLDGVRRAISYANYTLNQIESEIADSRTGRKMSFKSNIDDRDRYLYNQVGRSEIEDKAGVNMAGELGRVLSQFVGGQPQTPEQQAEAEFNRLEIERLQAELAESKKLAEELAGYED